MKQVVYFLIIAIFGWGCNNPQPISNPTFKSAFLSAGYQPTQVDFPLGVELREKWLMDDSDSSGGIKVGLRELQHIESTDLPHRILKPNAPIWYQRKVKPGDGVLWVSADDGAQVWLDSTRSEHLRGDFFKIEKSSDSALLTIRVLNNAMHGGLRAVKFIPQKSWESYREKKDSVEESYFQLRKRKLFNGKADVDLTNYPLMITDPVWQKSSNSQLVIQWVSEIGGAAEIAWGYDSLNLDSQVRLESENKVFQSRFPEVNQDFFYQVKQDQSVSKIYRKSYCDTDTTTVFTAWGDSQGGWAVFLQLINLMNQHKPAFSVGAGDLVAHGHEQMGYKMLLQSLSTADFHHYPVPGNHDYDGYYEDLHPENYFHYLRQPGEKQYFSWREGSCAFIALDPNLTFPIGIHKGTDQYDWFLQQLEKPFWKEASWRFILLHQPPLAQGWPGYHGEENIYELLEPYFETGEIDVVIAGHAHDYERLIKKYGNHKVAFLVLGGGGGGMEPLELSDWPKMDTVIKQHHFGIFEARPQVLNFKAYNLNSELIDSLVIRAERYFSTQ